MAMGQSLAGCGWAGARGSGAFRGGGVVERRLWGGWLRLRIFASASLSEALQVHRGFTVLWPETMVETSVAVS